MESNLPTKTDNKIGAENRMLKVKLIIMYDRDCYECDSPSVLSGITDWEEVSEGDFYLLREWTRKKNASGVFAPYGKYRDKPEYKYVLVTQPEIGIPKCLAEYVDMEKADQKAKEAKKAGLKKAKATKEANKRKKEKEEYEKLKAKFEKENK